MSSTTKTTLSKREENNQLKKTLIIETAIEMIEEAGGDSFNMKSLAETSGVPRATLYRYYTCKEELFHDIALYWGTNFRENLSQTKRSKRLDKALNQSFKAILQEARDRPELLRVIISDIFYVNMDATDFGNDFAQLFFALLDKFTDLEQHTLKEEDVHVLLRLLLANLQLVVSEKVSLKDALKNLSYCVDMLFR